MLSCIKSRIGVTHYLLCRDTTVISTLPFSEEPEHFVPKRSGRPTAKSQVNTDMEKDVLGAIQEPAYLVLVLLNFKTKPLSEDQSTICTM